MFLPVQHFSWCTLLKGCQTHKPSHRLLYLQPLNEAHCLGLWAKALALTLTCQDLELLGLSFYEDGLGRGSRRRWRLETPKMVTAIGWHWLGTRHKKEMTSLKWKPETPGWNKSKEGRPHNASNLDHGPGFPTPVSPLPWEPAGVCVYKLLSHVLLFVVPWTVALQAPLPMEFSRQEYWSGFPFSPLGYLPDPGIEPRSWPCGQILYHLSTRKTLLTLRPRVVIKVLVPFSTTKTCGIFT